MIDPSGSAVTIAPPECLATQREGLDYVLAPLGADGFLPARVGLQFIQPVKSASANQEASWTDAKAMPLRQRLGGAPQEQRGILPVKLPIGQHLHKQLLNSGGRRISCHHSACLGHLRANGE